MKGFRLLYIAGLLLLSPCALLAQSTAGDELSKLDFQTYLKELVRIIYIYWQSVIRWISLRQK